MTIQIKYAESEVERNEIYRLRHEIYIEELGDTKVPSGGYMTDAIDDRARLLMALDGDKLVGALRISWGGDGSLAPKFYKYFDLSRFSSVVPDSQIIVFDRFVVSPQYRGTQVPFQLLAATSIFSLEHDVQLAFCSCNPHLLNLYLGLGFRTYTSNYDSGGAGILVPLIFVCEDLGYLRKIGSPLIAFEQGYTFDSDVPHQVTPLIEKGKSGLESAKEEKITEWVQAYNLLSQTGTTKIAMFQDMSEADVTKILASSHIVECKTGDHLIVSGRGYHSMFIILSGSVEVRSGDQITGIRTEGDVVGEIGFLLKKRRIADVVAATDNVRVLSLREKTVRKLHETEPALAAQLMHNLARIVSLKMVSLYQRTFV